MPAPDPLDSLIDEAAAALPRGRPARLVPPSFVRNITAEDIPHILANRAPNEERPLQKLRHTHHQAARCLAEGRKLYEAAAITGYSVARLHVLSQDPTFQDLVAHYKGQTEAQYLNMHERLANLGIAVTEELQSRLDDAPDGLSNEDLRRWAETLLTFGIGKTANVNVKTQSLSLTLIEQVKREASGQGTTKMLTEG